MAKKKLNLSPEMKRRLILVAIVLVVVCIAALLLRGGRNIQPLVQAFPFLAEIFPQEQPEPESLPAAVTVEEGKTLRVHILDVGQADCILIQGPEKTMVIDGGESKNAAGIIRYLEDQGVEQIDYFLNTHPHADHLGGIVQVMKALPPKEFFYHPVPEQYTPTTRIYQNLLQHLVDNKIKTTFLNPGDTIDLGNGAVITYLSPLEEYSDMNNNSLAGRLVYGENTFLFTGDIETKSEKAILKSGAELSADVYSAPHHGSNTSSSQEFLNAVHPTYATISVGEGNDYGHPSPETLEKFDKMGITCLRTDECGAIVFTCDGRNMTVETEKGSYRKAA